MGTMLLSCVKEVPHISTIKTRHLNPPTEIASTQPLCDVCRPLCSMQPTLMVGSTSSNTRSATARPAITPLDLARKVPVAWVPGGTLQQGVGEKQPRNMGLGCTHRAPSTATGLAGYASSLIRSCERPGWGSQDHHTTLLAELSHAQAPWLACALHPRGLRCDVPNAPCILCQSILDDLQGSRIMLSHCSWVHVDLEGACMHARRTIAGITTNNPMALQLQVPANPRPCRPWALANVQLRERAG